MLYRFALLTSIALGGVLAGCASQVDGDHQGEVLATIQGSLQSMRTEPLPQPEVAVVWAQRSMMGGLVGAETVDAEGLFPNFTLKIFNPPPGDMVDGFDVPADGRYGVAYVVVARAGADLTDFTQWRGVDLNHLLVYLPQAAEPGSTVAGFLRGPASAGFHIYNVRELTTEEYQARLACITAIPHPDRMLTGHEIYTSCPGTDSDELTLAPGDLATELSIDLIEDSDLVKLINSIPHW